MRTSPIEQARAVGTSGLRPLFGPPLPGPEKQDMFRQVSRKDQDGLVLCNLINGASSIHSRLSKVCTARRSF